jgi:hypothetical protein
MAEDEGFGVIRDPPTIDERGAAMIAEGNV